MGNEDYTPPNMEIKAGLFDGAPTDRPVPAHAPLDRRLKLNWGKRVRPIIDLNQIEAESFVAAHEFAAEPVVVSRVTDGELGQTTTLAEEVPNGLLLQSTDFDEEERQLEDLWEMAADNVPSDKEDEEPQPPVSQPIEAPSQLPGRASKGRRFLSRMNPWKSQEETRLPERRSKRARNGFIGAVALASALIVGAVVNSHLSNGSEVMTAGQTSSTPAEIAADFNDSVQTVNAPESQTASTELRLPIPADRTQAEMPPVGLQQIAQNQRDLADFDRLVADINAGLSSQEIVARLDAAVALEHAQQLSS